MSPKKIMILDNYDSFTFNLVHLITEILGYRPDVHRNDEISLEEVGAYDTIVLSPGPGIPSEAGILLDVVRRYAPEKNIFGVCLGLQAIGEALGGQLKNLSKVFHGIQSEMKLTDKKNLLYNGIQEPLLVGRYHSWVIDKNTLPDGLLITAVDDQGEIMSASHAQYNLHGVQYHPESVLTPQGKIIVENFLKTNRAL